MKYKEMLLKSLYTTLGNLLIYFTEEELIEEVEKMLKKDK